MMTAAGEQISQLVQSQFGGVPRTPGPPGNFANHNTRPCCEKELDRSDYETDAVSTEIENRGDVIAPSIYEHRANHARVTTGSLERDFRAGTNADQDKTIHTSRCGQEVHGGLDFSDGVFRKWRLIVARFTVTKS